LKKNVTKLKESINHFMNPFATVKMDVLFCLSSGVPAPEGIEKSLLDAYGNGLEAHKKLAQERLVDKTAEEAKLKNLCRYKKVKKVT
jgi:hypothetical protein